MKRLFIVSFVAIGLLGCGFEDTYQDRALTDPKPISKSTEDHHDHEHAHTLTASIIDYDTIVSQKMPNGYNSGWHLVEVREDGTEVYHFCSREHPHILKDKTMHKIMMFGPGGKFFARIEDHFRRIGEGLHGNWKLVEDEGVLEITVKNEHDTHQMHYHIEKLEGEILEVKRLWDREVFGGNQT